jgi:hypothetical protein
VIFGHRHRHEAVAVQYENLPSFLAGRPRRRTVVLWRCRCGDTTTQELAGEWTIGQVRGERELTAEQRAEVDALVAAER